MLEGKYPADLREYHLGGAGLARQPPAGPGTDVPLAIFAGEVTFWAACHSSKRCRRGGEGSESWEEPVVYAVCAPRIHAARGTGELPSRPPGQLPAPWPHGADAEAKWLP
jgi:hypothetical protein